MLNCVYDNDQGKDRCYFFQISGQSIPISKDDVAITILSADVVENE